MRLLTTTELPKDVQYQKREDGLHEKKYKDGRYNITVIYNEPSEDCFRSFNKFIETKNGQAL
ncbi:hypothetical protein [Peribacillus frigoritolerans]|uniref:Uncharacterized protein n=1 Tax=Peribacillus frigoritolerans TaxID=450367 RepID=A0AAJ1VD86_9BACI|nr:hypothetical protein [Peribacillus frigoritolerans]MDM5283123.1 hypothetical protein [Peribacillus frigoritolerans]